jgi:hypothetical protein
MAVATSWALNLSDSDRTFPVLLGLSHCLMTFRNPRWRGILASGSCAALSNPVNDDS